MTVFWEGSWTFMNVHEPSQNEWKWISKMNENEWKWRKMKDEWRKMKDEWRKMKENEGKWRKMKDEWTFMNVQKEIIHSCPYFKIRTVALRIFGTLIVGDNLLFQVQNTYL